MELEQEPGGERERACREWHEGKDWPTTYEAFDAGYVAGVGAMKELCARAAVWMTLGSKSGWDAAAEALYNELINASRSGGSDG